MNQDTFTELSNELDINLNNLLWYEMTDNATQELYLGIDKEINDILKIQ